MSLEHNPSSLARRLRVLGLAVLGFVIASYLALYQLRFVARVWEPFFGSGSERVLHSFTARMLPVPDAALGATGYAAEILAGAIGGADRWRRHPKHCLWSGRRRRRVDRTLARGRASLRYSSRMYAMPALGRDLACRRLARA